MANYMVPLGWLIAVALIAIVIILVLTLLVGTTASVIALFTGVMAFIALLMVCSAVLVPVLTTSLAVLFVLDSLGQSIIMFGTAMSRAWDGLNMKRVKTISGQDVHAVHGVVMRLKAEGWIIKRGVCEEINAPYNYVVEMER